ncbi:Dps family protein [Bacillus sp. BF9-10]|uniref:Dps family protein n=1 Tax=Bacillus sp. BF9-10 TaxID=2217822 RepID=UPI0011CA2C3D|nr:Dps family protein [Bacillus sp. BF9-10]TXR75037.1 DNA starvation/stationary phase protection protein [Bacillus sp. BF9-10]
MNKQVIEVLNKQVANWSILFTKLHNFHWYVKGPQFFVLHEKFEEFYTEAATHIDEIAERTLAIGGEPVATIKEFLELASIPESTYGETAEGMVEVIMKDYKMMLVELKKGMEIAQEADDEMTSDLLLGIYTELEKHIWMLRAFLNQ